MSAKAEIAALRERIARRYSTNKAWTPWLTWLQSRDSPDQWHCEATQQTLTTVEVEATEGRKVMIFVDCYARPGYFGYKEYKR